MTLDNYLDNIRGRRVAVLGIGVSNRPLIKLLAQNGFDVTACDRSLSPDGAAELELLGARLRLGADYLKGLDADVIFRTPGLRPDVPELLEAEARGAIVTSEMEAFFEVCPCPIIAVTGSDGKTTTTTVIAELLRRAGKTVHIGGNIGTPLLCSAPDMSESGVAVLELSSFQLMTMKKSPHIAVVTNVAPNHLDVHRDMAEYIDAKRAVFKYQSACDAVVLNLDNEITRSFIPEAIGETRLFSRREPVQNGYYLKNGVIVRAMGGAEAEVVAAKDIFLPGAHNIENFMAAFAAVDGLAGIDAMRAAAREFRGVEHRIEYVRTLRGVKYYNDSIASSPTRTMAGLHSFDKKVILIAGGKDKGVPFDELGEEIAAHVKKLVLTGLTAAKIREAVEKAGPGPEIVETEGFKEAIVAASQMAEPGDVVILSPACTSFDRFKNFAERGDTFKRIVNELE